MVITYKILESSVNLTCSIRLSKSTYLNKLLFDRSHICKHSPPITTYLRSFDITAIEPYN